MNRKNYIRYYLRPMIVSALIIFLIGFNHVFFRSAAVGIVLSVLYFTLASLHAGDAFFRDEGFSDRLVLGCSFVLAGVSVVGSALILIVRSMQMQFVMMTLITVDFTSLILSRKASE